MNNYISGGIGAVVGFISGVLLSRKWFREYYEKYAENTINSIANDLKKSYDEERARVEQAPGGKDKNPETNPAEELVYEEVVTDYTKSYPAKKSTSTKKKTSSAKKTEPKVEESSENFQTGCSEKS